MSKFYIFGYSDDLAKALKLPSLEYSSLFHPDEHRRGITAFADVIFTISTTGDAGVCKIEYLKSRYPDHTSSIKVMSSEQATFYKISLPDIESVEGNFPW